MGAPPSHSVLRVSLIVLASVPFFTSTYSLPRILKVIIDHSILDHTIQLLDTLGYGGEWKAGLHLSFSPRLQRLSDETYQNPDVRPLFSFVVCSDLTSMYDSLWKLEHRGVPFFPPYYDSQLDALSSPLGCQLSLDSECRCTVLVLPLSLTSTCCLEYRLQRNCLRSASTERYWTL